jgi:hypothetical protein
MLRKLFAALLAANFLVINFACARPCLAQYAQKTMYGTNVFQSVYFSTDAMYVDVFMHASGWWTNPSTNVPLTPSGYPASGTATTLFYMSGYPSGDYKFYGKGNFSLNPRGGSFVSGTLQKNGDVTTALIHFDVEPTQVGGYYGPASETVCLFDVTVNDPNDPPSEFHLIHPDYPAWPNTNAEFTKAYLRAISPFTCLRMMDWMGTNGSTVSNWSDRPNPNLFGDGNQNDAYERFIDLANASNSDLWVNIPLYATDDWAKNFATLLAQRLNPNLHVYYEFSNECWNWGFSQWQQIEQWAQANPALTSQGAWERHNQQVMFCLMKYVKIMQPILGSRGRPIFAGQLAGVSYTAGAALDWLNTTYGPPSNYIFGISGAAYFSLSSADPNPTTLDDLFVSMNDNINADIATQVKQYTDLAQHYNLQFTCYESGQSLYSFGDQTTWAFYDQAQFDSRMGTCYQNLANVLQANGTYLCNFYAFIGEDSRYGWWGATNGVDLITANGPVKYQTEAAIALAGGLNDGKKTPPPGNNNPPGSGTPGTPGKGSPPAKHRPKPPKSSWPVSPGMGRKMSNPNKTSKNAFIRNSLGK